MEDLIIIKGKKAKYLYSTYYLTKCGKVYNLKKHGAFKKKVLTFKNSQLMTSINGSLRSVALLMLQVYNKPLYEKYQLVDYKVKFIDKDYNNLSIGNITIFKKVLSKRAAREKGLVFHEVEVNKTPETIAYEKSRFNKQQAVRDKRNRQALLDKQKEEKANRTHELYVHPEGYYCLKLQVKNKLTVVAKHHDNKVLELMVKLSKWFDTKTILQAGKDLSKTIKIDSPSIYQLPARFEW